MKKCKNCSHLQCNLRQLKNSLAILGAQFLQIKFPKLSYLVQVAIISQIRPIQVLIPATTEAPFTSAIIPSAYSAQWQSSNRATVPAYQGHRAPTPQRQPSPPWAHGSTAPLQHLPSQPLWAASMQQKSTHVHMTSKLTMQQEVQRESRVVTMLHSHYRFGTLLKVGRGKKPKKNQPAPVSSLLARRRSYHWFGRVQKIWQKLKNLQKMEDTPLATEWRRRKLFWWLKNRQTVFFFLTISRCPQDLRRARRKISSQIIGRNLWINIQ